MDIDDRDLLEKLLTAQVLTLAKVMKAASVAKGEHRRGDFVNPAVELIKDNQKRVIELLLSTS